MLGRLGARLKVPRKAHAKDVYKRQLPGQTEPKPLPSLLSPGIVLEALGK